MICPKCEEGTLKKVAFKKDKKIGFLCETCGALWFETEKIHATTGNTIQAHTKDNEMEYTFVDIDETDEDAQSVMYPKFK